MRTHTLKTWPAYWLALESGAKTFEVRQDDRGFQPGDTLVLQEWNPETEEYTGRALHRRVDYVLRDVDQFGLRPGYAVLGMRPVDEPVTSECPRRVDSPVPFAVGQTLRQSCIEALADGWITCSDLCPVCTRAFMSALDGIAGPLSWHAAYVKHAAGSREEVSSS